MAARGAVVCPWGMLDEHARYEHADCCRPESDCGGGRAERTILVRCKLGRSQHFRLSDPTTIRIDRTNLRDSISIGSMAALHRHRRVGAVSLYGQRGLK